MDAFFDVIVVIQAAVQEDGNYSARAWPFYLVPRADENGDAYFIIGVNRLNEYGWVKSHSPNVEHHTYLRYRDINKQEDKDSLRACYTTDKVYEIALEQLARQYRIGPDGDCYVSISNESVPNIRDNANMVSFM